MNITEEGTEFDFGPFFCYISYTEFVIQRNKKAILFYYNILQQTLFCNKLTTLPIADLDDRRCQRNKVFTHNGT